MKSALLKILVSFVLFIQIATAGPKDDARIETEKMKNYGQTVAQSMMFSDFQLILFSAASQVSDNYATMRNQMNTLRVKNEELERELLQFNQIDLKNVIDAEKKLKEIDDLWAGILRRNYQVSWMLTDASVDLVENLAIFQNAFQKMSLACASGRSDVRIDTVIKQGPKYIPNWSMEFGASRNGNGEPGFQVKYNSTNPKDPKGNETLTTITAASFFVASAVPGTPVGLVALAIGTVTLGLNMLSTRDAENEIERARSEAEQVRFNDWTRDAQIAHYYKNACSRFLPSLKEAEENLKAIQSGGVQAQQLITSLSQKNAEMKEVEKKLGDLAIAGCRSELRKQPVEKRDSNLIEQCQLEKNEKDQKTQETADVKMVSEIEKQVPMNIRIQFLTWKITQIFTGARNEYLESLAKQNDLRLNKMVSNGLNKYREAVAYVLQLKNSNIENSSSSVFIQQAEFREKFEQLRGAFIDLSAMGIKVIFNSKTNRDWLSAKETYMKQHRKLVNSYLYVDEVRTLNNLFVQLVRLVEKNK
ncbi:MAG: hypothetical protein B7Y39_02155 [Bdellovibrio sp. 28-41-41]|nr:MAG: hypothetical protein B7Y39_02155 [Bdellovibrio sp. 28-41-41]